MATAPKPKNLVARSKDDILAYLYTQALKPLLDELHTEMNTLIEAKKHFVIYVKEDANISPLAPFVQASLTFNYRRGETNAWQKWREKGDPTVEEPERFNIPSSCSANLVIEGLPGSTITVGVNYITQDYNGVFKVRPTQPNIDWGLNLGPRNFKVAETYLKGLTLAALKGTVALELVEVDEAEDQP